MLRSRSFWTLFGSYAALVLLAAVTIGSLTVSEVRRSLWAATQDYLEAQCNLLAPLAADDFAGKLGPEEAERLRSVAEANSVRITLIERSGKVLLDTEWDTGVMDNHLGRPEIQEALKSKRGHDTRKSATLGYSLVYAAYVPAGPNAGVIRVSQSTETADRRIARAIGQVLTGTAIVAVSALLLGLFVASRLTRPLSVISDAALAFESGDFEPKNLDLPSGELGDLGRVLNRMGVEIHARMRELQKDEGQLRAMLAGMVEGVIAVDEEDRISFSNAAARQLFNLGHLRVDGQRLWELIRVPGLDGLMERARGSDSAAHCELGLAWDGAELTILAKAHRFVTEKEIGVVIVFEDITELRRLEGVRRDFVANVSHELKTPLTSIRGYVETLMDGALHDENNNLRFLEKIDQNVKRLSALVVNLLSLAQIEEREVDMPSTRVDVRSVLAGILRRHEEDSRAKSIEIEVRLPPGPCAVLANEEGVIQVLENLVGNAIKYTPEKGHVWIEYTDEGDVASIDVHDNGVGIPPEDLERVFERFYRVDKARSRDVGGTGLGLSIVKHLAQSMGGEVSVESTLGRGSTFTVELPSTD